MNKIIKIKIMQINNSDKSIRWIQLMIQMKISKSLSCYLFH